MGYHVSTMRLFALLSAATLAAPGTAATQLVVVDEGAFTITRGAARAGRETFTIRRAPGPSGDAYVASGAVDLGGRQLAPALRTDASYAALAYQIEIRRDGQVTERLKGIVSRGRFSAQLRTAGGEQTKEYIVADGALVLDDDVFHQYYFVAQRAAAPGAGGGAIPVVVPQRSEQVMLRARWVADQPVTVGQTSIPARQLELTDPAGATRHVWVDAKGRVLKVALDAQGLVALRDAPPQ